MKKTKLIVILGPTASGKSALAVMLSKKFNGEIISADSRQIYKDLDKGTGKITKKEMRGIPHHLLDVWNPKKQVSVTDFVKKGNAAIQKINKKNKIPFVCGGTGFYIDSLVYGRVYPEVPPNTSLRKQLEKKSTRDLFTMLKKIDPERATNIDPQNPVRLVRAIEIVHALGKVPALREHSSFETLFIGIKIDPKKLSEKIKTRLKKRLAQGMIHEAETLHKNGLSFTRMKALGLEYKYLALYLEKKINKKELFTELEKAIWHYSRRQMTWFRKNKTITWFPLDKSGVKKIEKTIAVFLMD